MDNIKEENFVIHDIDINYTRGMESVYDNQANLANIAPQIVFKKKYKQLLTLKDELINQLTCKDQTKKGDKYYSDEKAEELYWVWFQLKIKQAIRHLYLNMIGNVLKSFKDPQEIATMLS